MRLFETPKALCRKTKVLYLNNKAGPFRAQKYTAFAFIRLKVGIQLSENMILIYLLYRYRKRDTLKCQDKPQI